MFRSIPGQTLVDSGIGNYVEPMVCILNDKCVQLKMK